MYLYCNYTVISTQISSVLFGYINFFVKYISLIYPKSLFYLRWGVWSYFFFLVWCIIFWSSLKSLFQAKLNYFASELYYPTKYTWYQAKQAPPTSSMVLIVNFRFHAPCRSIVPRTPSTRGSKLEFEAAVAYTHSFPLWAPTIYVWRSIGLKQQTFPFLFLSFPLSVF